MAQMKMTPLLAGKEGQCVSNLQRYFTRHLCPDTSGIKTIAVSARTMSGTAGNGNYHKNAAVHHYAGAIIHTKPRSPVIRTTLSTAVYFPTAKGILLCPEFKTTGISRSSGCGLGASVRKADDVTVLTVRTPSPPDAIRTVSSGCLFRTGMKTMKPTTTGASAQITHAPSTGTTTQDNHQAELLTKATNSLALALHQVRNATTNDGIKRAVGAANSAARSLNRWSAYSEKRKEVELVSVKDPRIARYYPETSGGLSAEPDGPWLLAIGRKCTDQQLERFAQREGFAAADLIDFRDSLVKCAMNLKDDGTPTAILGQIHSTRRGLLLLTHISDAPMVLKADELILWSLGCGQWYLTLGQAVPDWKLAKLAETEGIDFDGLIQLRDGLLEVASE